MTITQLEYTLAVARFGNFTLAAEKSFVTQPTLSMQVQKLEEELGVRIFNRNAKPIKATPIGEKILEQAKTIVEETHRVADIVAIEKGVIAGAFNLGILPTVMPTLLPIFLNTFIKKYPKVDLKIEEHTTENMERLLVEGKLDAGIAATPLNHDKINERPLYYEPFVGYVPPSHLLAKKETLKVLLGPLVYSQKKMIYNAPDDKKEHKDFQWLAMQWPDILWEYLKFLVGPLHH
jgi:LysR family hydrogen peroxide-inducible transcriptional activator